MDYKYRLKEAIDIIEEILCQDRTQCGCCSSVWDAIDRIKRLNPESELNLSTSDKSDSIKDGSN